MKVEVLESGEHKIYAVVFDKGEEVVSGLRSFANEHLLTGSHFTAIGAFRRVTLGYFDRDRRDYEKISIEEQVEVLALTGNFAVKGSERALHAHVVVGKSDGTAHGGHLLEATVWPTLEAVVEETPGHLQRRIDDETGLALLDV